jgi:hypothetical protein
MIATATPVKFPTTSKTFKAVVRVLSPLLPLLFGQQDMMARVDVGSWCEESRLVVVMIVKNWTWVTAGGRYIGSNRWNGAVGCISTRTTYGQSFKHHGQVFGRCCHNLPAMPHRVQELRPLDTIHVTNLPCVNVRAMPPGPLPCTSNDMHGACNEEARDLEVAEQLQYRLHSTLGIAFDFITFTAGRAALTIRACL